MSCGDTARRIRVGPLLGSSGVARRVRVLNRSFRADEVTKRLERLERLLDANVTVLDPKNAERDFERAMAGARPKQRSG
jgi:hypothetical protein